MSRTSIVQNNLSGNSLLDLGLSRRVSNMMSVKESGPQLPQLQKHRHENKVVKGHAMIIRDSKRKTITEVDGKKVLLNNSDVHDKEFGDNDKAGKESMTWKNRERDWYNAERRFIFACESKQEMKKWIKNFNNA